MSIVDSVSKKKLISLDITFLFKFSSKKHSSNNPAEEKSNSSFNFIIDDKLVTAKILVDVSMIFL